MAFMNKNKPMVTAHSGCEGTGIDTMDSIEKALEFGADAIEIDIRMDPFGDLRISHDPLSIEDYFRKNPLEDVFRMIKPTSLLINFDIKEQEALYKTLDAALDFGFPTERLIFTGCTDPDLLIGNAGITGKANFFLNLEKVLISVILNRKEEFGRDIVQTLTSQPYVILLDDKTEIPNIFLPEAVELRHKIETISGILSEKIFEDTVLTYRKTGAAAANLPKFLLVTDIAKMLKSDDIALSVWTVDEPDLIQKCVETGVQNITTRRIGLTKQILKQFSA